MDWGYIVRWQADIVNTKEKKTHFRFVINLSQDQRKYTALGGACKFVEFVELCIISLDYVGIYLQSLVLQVNTQEWLDNGHDENNDNL